jgi:hypothetical protein
MAVSHDGGEASGATPSRTYRLLSATYQDKACAEGLLMIDDAGSEIELRQWTGKKKKEETVIARFHLEPDADVLVDGPLLRVSELSVTLESSAMAGEAAEMLRRPARERESLRLLSEAESSVGGFLEAREEAMGFLSLMKADPREALVSAEGMWASDDTREPFDAVYSGYSVRLADSLEKMTSFLAGEEKNLGSGVTDRLYALACTIGGVQNALFEADSDLAPELAALQELGISTTAEDLRMEKPTEKLIRRAHQVLESLATPR